MTRLSTADLVALKFTWRVWARAEQVRPPDPWEIWLLLMGRGSGKTRSGAECIREWVEEGFRKFALVSATPADFREVMLEGESGLLNVFPPPERPTYQPSRRRLVFHTGAVAHVYSAHKHEDKSGMRGPQHEKGWGDEPQKWQYPGNYDQLMFGMRIGANPQVVLTCTPRRIKLIRELVARAKARDGVVMSVGSSHRNIANLSDVFIKQIIRKYEGTRLGRQEIEGLLLEDVDGALWQLEWIERDRLPSAPRLVRTVVAVDPPGSVGLEAAECGVIVAGVGEDGQGYLLEDVSLNGTPAQWAEATITAFHRWGADCIVGEANNGGEMVRHTIRSAAGAANLPVKLVWASKGKYRRAEPISLLNEQVDPATGRGRVHHVGVFQQLEDQMTTWVQGETSPDRLDAYVWAFTELLLGGIQGLSGGGASASPDETMVPVGAQQVDEAIAAQLRQRGVMFPERG